MRKLFIVLALLTAFALATTVSAQTPTPNQINEVARDLWCPLCNGVRLDNCELQACVQMREVICAEAGRGREQGHRSRPTSSSSTATSCWASPSTEGFNLIA